MTIDAQEILRKLPAERRARIEKRVAEALATMALDELREARKLTQAQLAKKLHIGQEAICKLEKRSDMLLSTLDSVVSGMGGRLELRAIFPSGEANLIQITKERIRQRKRAAPPLKRTPRLARATR